MKLPISVVIIAKNEEQRIYEALKSVEWADDIVVVDDFSTDKTKEICTQFGARVFQRKLDIEGRHRNWAHAQARHTWVLSLDADERVTSGVKDELALILQNGPHYNGYEIPLKNYIGDYWIRYGGWYPSPKLRFFKKDEFRWEESEVHPRVFMEGPRGSLKSEIIHYNFVDFSDAVRKVNNQTTLEAMKWVRENRKISLGKCSWKAVDRFFRAYVRKKGYKDGYVGFVLAFLGSLYQVLSYAKYRWLLDSARAKVT